MESVCELEGQAVHNSRECKQWPYGPLAPGLRICSWSPPNLFSLTPLNPLIYKPFGLGMVSFFYSWVATGILHTRNSWGVSRKFICFLVKSLGGKHLLLVVWILLSFQFFRSLLTNLRKCLEKILFARQSEALFFRNYFWFTSKQKLYFFQAFLEVGEKKTDESQIWALCFFPVEL